MALKVYGGNGFIVGKQVRMIVAARSWKRVSELTGTTTSYLKTYWSVTGNKDELETAFGEPEVVFYRGLDDPWKEKYDWKRFEKKVK
jgi:hypothetical protein